jgi:starch synthase
MAEKLKILITSAEVVPFAKAGGLADVAGALPKVLKEFGHDVKVIMPKYGTIDEEKFGLEPIGKSADIPIGDWTERAEYWTAKIPETDVDVYFVDNERYFDRDGIYSDEKGMGYGDNDERFIFFSRAVVEFPKALGWRPDVIHNNDFHTGLVPAYLKTIYSEDEFLRNIPTVFSIHNLGYQGVYDPKGMWLAGFDQSLFYPTSPFEFYGNMNFMKTGIVFSDAINTVSEKYAREIQTEEQGHGLEGVLQSRVNDLYGILNGVDYERWDPETDPLIYENYTFARIGGKRHCKAELKRELNMPLWRRKKFPLIGMIGRLTDQKGFDILTDVIDEFLQMDLQFVLLGTGEEKYHKMFKEIADKYPKKTGIILDFNNELAHKIEAGSDMFLMPSKYEPCGLNQMYSLKYGTIPIVRATGGLADTIVDYNSDPDYANGFSFKEYTSEALLDAVRRAVELFKNTPDWKVLMERGMNSDFSWKTSAKKYEKLYQKAINKRK